MVERLTRLDASFLYLEEPDTPMHVGGVLILETPRRRRRRAGRPRGGPAAPGSAVPPAGGGGPRAPRQPGVGGRPGLRHRLPRPPLRAASAGHRGAAAGPGVPPDLAAAGPDASAVGGVPGRGPVRTNRVAVVTKTHPGAGRRAQRPRHRSGAAGRGPGRADAGARGVAPAAAARAGRELVWAGARRVRAPALGGRGHRPRARSPTSGRPPPGSAGSPVGCCGPRGRRSCPAPNSPLNASVGRQRRVAVARAELDDLKKIRKAHGGTVNDVLLTVVTGALREWLLSRGEPVVAGTSVRALVPVSMQDEDAVRGQPGLLLPGRPAGRRTESPRAADPAQLRDAGDRPARPVGGRGQPHRADGVRARRHCTRSVPARRGGCPAGCSTWSSPTCPARSCRCTRPAAGCSRCSRSCRWPAVRASRSG